MAQNHSEIRTIYDIAKVAGVSPTTVSFVINGKGNINPETRKRIKEIISRSRYTPSRIAQQLRMQRTNSIGVVIDHFHNRFWNSVFDGIESAAGPKGYSFLAAESREDAGKESKQIALLMEHGVDGLILFPCTEDATYLKQIQKRYSVPIILIGNYFNDCPFPSVTADNRGGAEAACLDLLSLQDRPVLHIAGPQKQSMCRDRRQAFVSVLKEQGHPGNIDDHIFQTDDLSISEGYKAMKQIENRFLPPFSLFVVNDDTAFGVIKFCNEKGWKIPGDVAVIGFGDIDLIGELDMGLSSVQIPAFEMGTRAAELLFSSINTDSDKAVPPQIILPVSLIRRKSS